MKGDLLMDDMPLEICLEKGTLVLCKFGIKVFGFDRKNTFFSEAYRKARETQDKI